MSDTKITQEELRHVAKLARLPLTEEQEAKYLPQLESILDYFDILKKTDTSKTEPTYQTTGLKNVTREDIIDKDRMFTQKQALSCAPKAHQGFFVTKATIKK